MGNLRTVPVTHTEVIDTRVRRGVTYTGLSNLKDLQQKLHNNFSLPLASEFPMYKYFPEPTGHHVVGYYYKPPRGIKTLKRSTLDRSLDNILLSHLPSWTALPDRETSAMVHTSQLTARALFNTPQEEDNIPGTLYRAIPAMNAQLVIAPTPHIRYAFQHALEAFNITHEKFGPLTDLQSHFYDLLHACGKEDALSPNWELFLASLQDIATEKIQPNRTLLKDTAAVYATLTNNKSNLLQFLDKTFSPSLNGFHIENFSENIRAAAYPDNEVWMASPCLLIEEGLFEEMRSRPTP